MSTLTLFPNRVPIGRVKNPTGGQDIPVMMSPEFERALSALFERVGGDNALDVSSLELLASASPAPSINIGSLVDAVSAQIAAEVSAQLAELRKQIESVEVQAGYVDPFRVNWERPGTIGSLTPNSGAFTTLTASGAVTLSPANADVMLSPTGAGVVTINPATAGSMNNVDVGATTPKTVKSTTLQATGAFGCNGAAVQVAAASGGAVSTTGATNASPFGYTTAAQADGIRVLLNNIRAALVANGIMS